MIWDVRFPMSLLARRAAGVAWRLVAFATTIPPLGAAHAQSFEGVWASEGYGLVFDIRGSQAQVYEVTSATCVPSFRADRVPSTSDGTGQAFRRSDRASSVYDALPDSSPDRMRWRSAGVVSDIMLRRIPGMPRVCDTPTPDTPEGNFEVFWRTWDEHYILFDQKRSDWHAVVARVRPRVTPRTTPRELFDVFSEMIAPFEDAHTNISAGSVGGRFVGFRKGTDALISGGVMEAMRSGFRRFFAEDLPRITGVTNRGYVRGPLRVWCNGQLQYGALNDSTGYLRILSFSNYDSSGSFAQGLTALDAALDTIFADAALRALVIDVRVNFGGSDRYALTIASRLTAAPYVAYTKVARADPVNRNRRTPGQPSVVQPSHRASFYGPVIELIGPLTISAGETFTQALMGRTPRVERIGENTQGVFSDVLSRRLPNGWTFGLPNEVFLTNDGTTYDGPGIPPTVPVPVFASADLRAQRDPALGKALELLTKR